MKLLLECHVTNPVSFSPLCKLLPLTNFAAGFGENVVDQDPPFDPAKDMITSACINQRACISQDKM
jgi:hypothetical protein